MWLWFLCVSYLNWNTKTDDSRTISLRKKCLYSGFFRSVFSRIWTEFGDLLRRIKVHNQPLSPKSIKIGFWSALKTVLLEVFVWFFFFFFLPKPTSFSALEGSGVRLPSVRNCPEKIKNLNLTKSVPKLNLIKSVFKF